MQLVESNLQTPIRYRIQVLGKLDASWSAWFDGLAISVEKADELCSVTTLAGVIADQGALHGILSRIRDLGIPLLLVQCLDPQVALTNR